MSKSIVCENLALYQYIAAIPAFENVLLHYHENLSLEVVLRVRKCTHMAVSLDIQTSRLQRGGLR